MSTIDRVLALLQLASKNSNEEEARTAAVQACRQIIEHKFLVSERAPWDELGVSRQEFLEAFRELQRLKIQTDQEILANERAQRAQHVAAPITRHVPVGIHVIRDLDDESHTVLASFFGDHGIEFHRVSLGVYRVQGSATFVHLARALEIAFSFIELKGEDDEDGWEDHRPKKLKLEKPAAKPRTLTRKRDEKEGE